MGMFVGVPDYERLKRMIEGARKAKGVTLQELSQKSQTAYKRAAYERRDVRIDTVTLVLGALGFRPALRMGEAVTVCRTAEDLMQVIRREQVRKGCSDRRLAELTGLKEARIRGWHYLGSKPGSSQVIRVCAALGVEFGVVEVDGDAAD